MTHSDTYYLVGDESPAWASTETVEAVKCYSGIFEVILRAANPRPHSSSLYCLRQIHAVVILLFFEVIYIEVSPDPGIVQEAGLPIILC